MAVIGVRACFSLSSLWIIILFLLRNYCMFDYRNYCMYYQAVVGVLVNFIICSDQ